MTGTYVSVFQQPEPMQFIAAFLRPKLPETLNSSPPSVVQGLRDALYFAIAEIKSLKK